MPKTADPAELLKAMEQTLGEPLLYRTTGRFLGAGGLPEAPLQSWGLIVLTKTRVVFHHYPNPHPLFGGSDPEIHWEASRSQFSACEARNQPFWTKLLSGVPDHVSFTGPDTHLELEIVDLTKNLVLAWNSPPP